MNYVLQKFKDLKETEENKENCSKSSIIDFLKDSKTISEDLKFLWKEKLKNSVQIPRDLKLNLLISREND